MPGLKWHECPRCKFWIDCETAPTYHTRIPEIAERQALIESCGANKRDLDLQQVPAPEPLHGGYTTNNIDISRIKVEKSFENDLGTPSDTQKSPMAPNSTQDFLKLHKTKVPELGRKSSAMKDLEVTDENTMNVEYDKMEDADFENPIKTEMDNFPGDNTEDKKPVLRPKKTTKLKKTWECQHCKRIFRTKLGFNEHNISFPNSSCKKRDQSCYMCGKMCQPGTEWRSHLKTHSNDLEFKCLKCPSVFETARHLREHTAQSHGVSFVAKNFHCNVDKCGKSFMTRYQLWMHNKRFHGSDDPHVCTWCGKTYKFRHSLRIHVQSVHEGTKLKWKPFECPNCAKRFITKKEFQKHMADFGNQMICERQSVECCVCGFTFWNKETLRKHYKTHSHFKVFECRRCDAKFPLLGRLRDHTLRHIGTRDHQCPLCGKMFKSKNEVNSHMNGVHAKERKFPCNLCQKAFKTRDCLNTHKKFVHEKRTKSFKCELCPNVAFQYRTTLLKHMEKHKMEHPFQCRLCPYQSHYRKSYEKHFEKDHEGQLPYMCVECFGGFLLESNLRDHLIGVHGHVDITQDWHTCAVCNTSFVFKKQLEIHLRKHQNMTHKCSFCLKEFKDRHLADTHMALVHKAGEKFEHLNSKFVTCEVCGKSFPHRAKLERHALSHSNIRPYKCLEPGCPSAFKDESTLKNHMKRLHLGGLEKPCKCDICGKCFVHNNKLREHARVHSGEKPYSCPVCNFSCAIKGNLTKHMKVHK